MEIVALWIPAVVSVLALAATLVFGVINAKQAAESARQAGRSADSSEKSLDLSRSQLESAAAAQAESLRLAQEQLENSVRAHQDSVQPYIWADLRARDDGRGLMQFVVGNSGSTVATEIRIEFMPPLDHIVPKTEIEMAHHIQDLLAHGLESLPPGKTIAWTLGVGWSYFAEADPPPESAMSIRITANGPHGPIMPASYSVSLSELKHQALRPVGLGLVEAPLRDLEKRLKELTTHVERIEKALARH